MGKRVKIGGKFGKFELARIVTFIAKKVRSFQLASLAIGDSISEQRTA